MKRREFIKQGALWVPTLFAIGKARGQALSLRDPAFVRKASVGSSCATTDTSIAHDELLEGFQTASTGYENTWVEYGTTANITAYADTSALTSGKPTGACDRAWKLVVPSDGTETYAKWTRGSAISNSVTVDVVFYMYISALPAAGHPFMPFVIAGEYLDPIVRVHIYNNYGDCLIRAQTSTSSDYISGFTAGAWHKIAIHLDATPANSTFTVDSGTAMPFTRITGPYTDISVICIGPQESLNAGDADGISLYIDLICVNTP